MSSLTYAASHLHPCGYLFLIPVSFPPWTFYHDVRATPFFVPKVIGMFYVSKCWIKSHEYCPELTFLKTTSFHENHFFMWCDGQAAASLPSTEEPAPITERCAHTVMWKSPSLGFVWETSVVAHALNPSIQDEEAGRNLWVQNHPGQLGLHCGTFVPTKETVHGIIYLSSSVSH